MCSKHFSSDMYVILKYSDDLFCWNDSYLIYGQVPSSNKVAFKEMFS